MLNFCIYTFSGFNATSRLCHTCAFNHRRIGTHRCARCPASAEMNWVLMLVGVIITIVLLCVLVKVQIGASGTTNLSELIQKSFINYFQVAALFGNFPLSWPKILRDFFEIQGAFSTLGDHLLNPDCAVPFATAAELFYEKQIGYLLLPPSLVVVIYLFWKIYSVVRKQQWHRTIEEKQDTTGERGILYVKDKFVTSICFLIYLLFPTVVKQAFGVFNCYTIGGKPYLLADLEESCYQGRHIYYIVFVGVPQVLFYVIGLPLCGLYFLHRNKDRLNVFAVRARYSLFFTGYRDDRYYWEIVVVFRKVAVIAISVFCNGIDPELQALLVLFLIMTLVAAQYIGSPYKSSIINEHGEEQSLDILQSLELSMMFMLNMTLWSGLMLFKLKASVLKEIITMLTVIANVCFISCVMYRLISQSCQEKRDKKNPMVLKVDILRKSFTALFTDSIKKDSNKETKVLEINVDDGVFDTSIGGISMINMKKDQKNKTRKEPIAIQNELIDGSWQSHIDEGSGKTYFYNASTGETKWEEEESVTEVYENTNAKTSQHHRLVTELPPGWNKHHSEEHDVNYYTSTSSGATQWERPEGSTLKRVQNKLDGSWETGSSPHHHTRDSTRLPPNWDKYNDGEGRRYYSNNNTQESSWAAPEGSTGGSAKK